MCLHETPPGWRLKDKKFSLMKLFLNWKVKKNQIRSGRLESYSQHSPIPAISCNQYSEIKLDLAFIYDLDLSQNWHLKFVFKTTEIAEFDKLETC